MEDNKFKIQTFFDELFNSNIPNYQTKDEETSKYFDVLLKEFYDTNNMKLKSDLSKDQIFLLTRMTIFTDIFQSNVMRKAVNYILEYSVSKDRKGRIEFSEIFKFANELKTDNMGYDNALAGLLGVGRR